MTTDATFRRTLTAIGLAFAMGLLGPNSLAQVTLNSKSDPSPQPVQAAAEINLEISNGQFLDRGTKKTATIRNIVDFVNRQEPGANIVYSPEAAEIVIKDLTLKTVNPESFCRAVRVATDSAVGWQSEKQVWGLFSTNRQSPRRMEAFNLTGYLDRLGSKDEKKVDEALAQVVGIIRDTAEMVSKDGSTSARDFDIRFHRGANLLVVVGSEEAIGVARNVVHALAAGPPVSQIFVSPPPASPTPPAAVAPLWAVPPGNDKAPVR